MLFAAGDTSLYGFLYTTVAIFGPILFGAFLNGTLGDLLGMMFYRPIDNPKK